MECPVSLYGGGPFHYDKITIKQVSLTDFKEVGMLDMDVWANKSLLENRPARRKAPRQSGTLFWVAVPLKLCLLKR